MFRELFFSLRFSILFVPDPCDFRVSKMHKLFMVQMVIWYSASQNVSCFCRMHRRSITNFRLVFRYQCNSPRHFFKLQINTPVLSMLFSLRISWLRIKNCSSLGATKLRKRKMGKNPFFLLLEEGIVFLGQIKNFQVSKWEAVKRLPIVPQNTFLSPSFLPFFSLLALGHC